ncbi:ABC transporter permease, partial [Myxococcus sp. AM011]|nr:ABC transporter permease [Myxococcus sp. AM011]
MRTLPGVSSAALASTVPLRGRNGVRSVLFPGESPTAADTRELATFRTVSEGLFKTLGIPLKEGRALTDTDTASAPQVMVVNETFARRHFPDGQALGKRVKLTMDGEDYREVVGVARDVRHGSVGETWSTRASAPRVSWEDCWRCSRAGCPRAAPSKSHPARPFARSSEDRTSDAFHEVFADALTSQRAALKETRAVLVGADVLTRLQARLRLRRLKHPQRASDNDAHDKDPLLESLAHDKPFDGDGGVKANTIQQASRP